MNTSPSQFKTSIGRFRPASHSGVSGSQIDVAFIPRVWELLRDNRCPLALYWELQNNEAGKHFGLRGDVGGDAPPLHTWGALRAVVRGGASTDAMGETKTSLHNYEA